MVFDEDGFSLNASPSITDLDFLCESGSKVSIIGTRLTTVGTSIPAPRRTAPEIPPGFELLVAPLPVLTVPPGFLPRAATTTMPRAAPPVPPAGPRVAPTAPPTVCPPVRVRPHRSPMSGTLGNPRQRVPLHPSLLRPSVGGQGVVVPVTPPENPHRMITRGKTGFRVVPDRHVLTAVTSSLTPSPILSSACTALDDPHWRATMEEYGALMSNGT
jgi:hypothetical protein